MKKLHLIFDIGFVLFITFFCYIFITVYRGNIPNVFGYHFLRVVSSSMEPQIKEGDCIISKSVDTDEIKKGDIITFYSEDPAIYNYLNTHRVIGIIENDDGTREFLTKGDANPGEDVFTAKEDKIIGRYEGELFFGKVISKGFELLSNRIVYFILVLLPILLSFISSIVDIIKIIFEESE